MSTSPKIYDCFTIWNELDMIEARLEYLYPHVDYFVLVESNKLHNGKSKPYYFEENRERYSKYLDKIIHIKDDKAPDPGSNGWGTENHTRNCEVFGLKDAKPNDIILISDVDEIPNIQNFNFLKTDAFGDGHAIAFSHMHHNYYVNIVSPFNPAVGTVAVKKSTLDCFNPQHMRNIKDRLPRFLLGGWHLSYMGGINKIWEKFTTSTPADVPDPENIPPVDVLKQQLIKRLKEGQFNVRHDVDHKVSFIQNPYLPYSITKEKYPHFFLDNLDDLK